MTSNILSIADHFHHITTFYTRRCLCMAVVTQITIIRKRSGHGCCNVAKQTAAQNGSSSSISYLLFA